LQHARAFSGPPTVRRRLAVAVWAEHSEIFEAVVAPHPVDVIDLNS
jgi:hypothetical protein